jgi:hypothetical protein
MLLTYTIQLVQHLQQTRAVFLSDSVANQQMPVPIRSILQYKLP